MAHIRLRCSPLSIPSVSWRRFDACDVIWIDIKVGPYQLAPLLLFDVVECAQPRRIQINADFRSLGSTNIFGEQARRQR